LLPKKAKGPKTGSASQDYWPGATLIFLGCIFCVWAVHRWAAVELSRATQWLVFCSI
jgi:hypothetical protein